MDFQEMLITEKDTMIDAMKALEKTAKKVLFVVRDDKLVAAVTDGDIRRWILAKGQLDAYVSDFAKYNPKYVYEYNRDKAHGIMEAGNFNAIPVVDDDLRIVDVILLQSGKRHQRREKLDIPVVIMAGGKGTRLYPYTKILPKALMPIGDIPITEHIINRFIDMGCKRFYMIVNHKGNMIKSYFNDISKDYELTFIDEEKPLGTGGGISLLKGIINETFILNNCDTIIEEDYDKIYRCHKENDNVITMICSLKNFTIPYGVVDTGSNGKIEKMTEKPELSFLVNTGCYIVNHEIINEIEENINITFPEIMQAQKEKNRNIGIYPISENQWMDMGQFNEMDKMIKRIEGDNE